MGNKIRYSSLFVRKAKILKKKHASLKADLAILEKSLIDNPKQGDDLGAGIYKVRLAIKSKNKGKSGGYRVITYLVSQTSDSIDINFITLYDKSEESSINKQLLLKLVENLI
ncbi:type II toxin-antitoxin system RelE/ParE family toxin [uncultured Mucilaginibacter sp.]|jgi:hypothetical protein|uniref:type II toxin-antitoxin system RelE/ParE family toxin n=1 Tax=uncultured Mucilaginibacter sp. TaxID=797541 RepID=UPI0025DBE9B6|nr:type II toxin-antitoxin system RelE/ParE family toxin [uncultured Mucilaginibacter sp.]HWZ04909.1 type II toxin-antitoxin system RelE/ParE family toxin [Mucilaginibacter sp.]